MRPTARIRVLSAAIVNRIAAGEVVERPASVVKELVENSLDAEASHIEVALEMGGRKYIRVADDGIGMTAEDLALAFRSHATSKLVDADDLFAIHSLGFRGEALASIGAVSRARIVSRARGSLEGAEVWDRGGEIGPVTACGAPEGTTVEVRDLFYNVPARQKFLRSVATEFAHASETFTRLALPFPTVTFRLEHDGRTIFHLPGGVELPERIRQLFGDNLAALLFRTFSETTALRALALAAPPTEHRPNTQMLYTFLNGRYIRDRNIYRAIADAYSETLPAGRQPVVFLFLEMDPHRVDVNVHPTKVEVRFREPGAVYAQIEKMLREALRPRAASVSQSGQDATCTPDRPVAAPSRAQDRHHATEPLDRAESVRRAISNFFSARPAPPMLEQPRTSTQRPPASTAPLPAVEPAVTPSTGRITQVLDTYIIEEVAEGIRIIDQHALHERILYEELSRAQEQGRAISQRLLLPLTVELRPHERTLALHLAPLLAEFGFIIEEFGGNAVVIQAVPQQLELEDARAALIDMLSESGSGAVPHPEIRDRALRVLACKGAVKAGQPLRPEQVRKLLEHRDALGVPATCPHGRRIAWLLTREELARHFGRK